MTEEGNRRTKRDKGAETSTGKSGTNRPTEKWLLANCDYNANIYAISSGVTLADLYQDGDYRLLIGDIGVNRVPKLKVK